MSHMADPFGTLQNLVMQNLFFFFLNNCVIEVSTKGFVVVSGANQIELF